MVDKNNERTNIWNEFSTVLGVIGFIFIFVQGSLRYRKVFEYKNQLQVSLGKINLSVYNFVLDFGLDMSYCSDL